MKRSLTIITIVAYLLFAGARADAKDSWHKVQSKNFTLVGNVSDGDMRKIAFKLEQFRETLSLILPKVKITTPVPTTVVLFDSDQSFRPFKPRYQGKIKDNVGGYFLPGPHMNYIVLSVDKERISPYKVIFHEYEHFFLHNNLLHLPLWLDEGLAEFYSTFETDGELKVTLGVPVPEHVFYLRSKPLLPFKTLLSVDQKSPHYNESSKAGMFYAESWALVHYLMNGNDQKQQPQLVRFIDLLNSGSPIEESFQKVFQVNFNTFQEELDRYIRGFTFPVLKVTFRNELNISKDMEATTLSESESQYYQGDLLFYLRQFPEAKALLEKSIAADPKLGSSRVTLGMIHLSENREDEAEKVFQSAIDAEPGNYLAHFYYGEMLLAKRRYEDAINSYKQAVLLKPDIARIYSQLGYAYMKANQEDEAIKTFEKGISVNPKETYFYRSLGYIYFRRGQGELSAGEAYSYLARQGWREEHSQYMALLWYFSLRQMKNVEFATKSLQNSIAKVDPADWPYPVMQYLNHALTLNELLEQAKDVDQQTEAHAYAGFELLFNGEREAALEHLHWVRDKGNRNFVEYGMALAELARLEGPGRTQ